MYSIFIITWFIGSVNRTNGAQILINYENYLDFLRKIGYDGCKCERQWRCTVAFRFLSERGSHRLKASLSSNEMSNFPPELSVPNLLVVSYIRQRVVRNVMRVKQMRVRVIDSGSWVVPRNLFRPLHGNMQGTFLFACRQSEHGRNLGSLLPNISDYANAPTTERLCREGPHRPVDGGSGRTETEWRRGQVRSTDYT